MTLQAKINGDIRKAMKARNTDQLAALRSAKSAIMLEATKEGLSSVDDEVVLNIISKLVKQRNDSARIYNEQAREDLAQDELNQIKYLLPYLPKQLTEEEVRVLVQETIVELNEIDASAFIENVSDLPFEVIKKPDLRRGEFRIIAGKSGYQQKISN